MVKKTIKTRNMLFIFISAVLLLFALCLAQLSKYDVAQGETALKKSDVFKIIESGKEIADNTDLPSFSTRGNGVKLLAEGAVAEFCVENTIDATYLTKKRNVISFQVLNENELEFMQSIEFIFTDVTDDANRVSMYFVAPINPAVSYPYGESYARVGYRSLYKGHDTNDASQIWNGIYGATVYGNTFCGSKYPGSTTFSFQFDYAEKSFYINNGSFCVLNLNNSDDVGANLWKGFKDGTAKMSIIMKFSRPMVGGIIATELFGHSLQGAMTTADEDVPTLSANSWVENPSSIPVGAVGYEYKLPKVNGFDWYNGISDVDMRVFLGADEVVGAVKNNYFTPTSSGAYEIRYRCENSFKKVENLILQLTVLDKLSDLRISFDGALSSPTLLQNYTFPSVVATGGSGEISVSEQVEYNGRQVLLSADRKCFINEVGYIKYKVTVKGYTGSPFSQIYFLKIQEPLVCMFVSEVPKYLIKGENILPDFIARAKSGGEVVKSITVDGENIDMATRKFTVNKNSNASVAVCFIAESGEHSVSETYNLTVKEFKNPNEYFIIDAGNPTITLNTDETMVKTSSNTRFSLPFAVSAENFNVRLSVDKALSGFEYFDMIFTDLYTNQDTVFHFTRGDNIRSFVDVNDGKKYPISGSFSGDVSFVLTANVRSGELLVGNKPVLNFDKWEHACANFSIAIGGVNSESALKIVQLSNQLFKSASFREGDKTEPVLLLEKSLVEVSEIKINEKFCVPSASAYDVLSSRGAVSVRVLDPAGEELYNGVAKEQVFKGEKYGFYTIKYKYEDTLGNFSVDTYRYKVIDEIKPTINIVGSVDESYKLGESFVVPTITATDNVDESCYVSASLIYKQDYKTEILAPGSSYTFNKVGNYELTLYARDSRYNFSKKTFSIVVKEKK